jgi:hypothetical protein
MKIKTIAAYLLLIAAVTSTPVSPVYAAGNEKPSGTIQIRGIIMDHDTNKPVTDKKVQLFAPTGAPDKDGWVKLEDLKITTTTSSKGEFVFEKLAPGRYTMMVEYVSSAAGGMTFPASVRKKDGSELIVTAKDGETIDIGEGWIQMR